MLSCARVLAPLLAVLLGACAANTGAPPGGRRWGTEPLGPGDDPTPDASVTPPPDGGSAPDGATGTGIPGPVEPCDGFDNNGNGEVDERCLCAVDTTQECYPGPPGSDRGMCTRGVQSCSESTSTHEFYTWGPCVGFGTPSAEVCGNGADENCDGVDELCPPPPDCVLGETRECYTGPAGTMGVGTCHAGTQACTATGTWGPCTGEAWPGAEVCGNGVDEDCNGADVGCPECSPGASRPCYDGPAGTAGVGLCHAGSELCTPSSTWGACTGYVLPGVEVCGNGVDEDCNGADEVCPPVRVPFVGECITVMCPADHPYPVGCFWGTTLGKNHACVAHEPGSRGVFFKAGDSCSLGFTAGYVDCSDVPGDPLSPFNCPVLVPLPQYVTHRSMCAGE